MFNNKTLQENKKYTFNEKTNKYVFHTEEKFGRNIVLAKDKIDSAIKLYSNFDKLPLTIGEISLKMNIPSEVLKHIFQILKITHSSLPFSDERIEEYEEDELVEEMAQSKKFNILQKFEKRDWKDIQQDAEKWRELELGQIEPIKALLDTWIPPKYIPRKYNYPKFTSDKELIIGASDWHYGLFAEERFLDTQKEWNIGKTCEAVELYSYKLQDAIRQNKYKRINLNFAGDIIHTLTGFTDKGTKLQAHPIGEELLDIAFDSCINFIESLLAVHNNIRVFACSGNHSALGDYVLYKMLSIYYLNDSRISFEITNKQSVVFRVYDNLFLLRHGYSPYTKERLPKPGKARELYINNLFMSDKNYSQSDRLYFLSADLHHMESYEMTNVEGYMFPTLVGGCRYADQSGFKSRPRQTALVVNQEGVSEVLNFYLDV